MKLNYSPILKHLAERYELSPGEVHKALEAVAPGGVSRRAVGYWFADPGSKSARRCDPHWVSLFLSSLLLSGKAKKSEVRQYIESISAIDEMLRFDKNKASKEKPSKVNLDLLQLVLDSSERRDLALGHRRVQGSHWPFDPRRAISNIPGV